MFIGNLHELCDRRPRSKPRMDSECGGGWGSESGELGRILVQEGLGCQ